MKYFSRLNTYKASNVEFNPETQEATSYGWWTFFKVINGTAVFNAYNYSNSTCKHQQKVRALLSDLGIKIDLIVEAPEGLQRDDWKAQCLSEIRTECLTLVAAIKKPRSQKRKNEERTDRIFDLLQLKKKILAV